MESEDGKPNVSFDPKAEEKLTAPIEPALTITYTKVRLHPDDIQRILTDKLPGYIPFFTQGGANFPGCRLIHFDAFGNVGGLDKEVEEYFKKAFDYYGKSTVADAVNAFFANFANYYRAHEIPDGQGGLFLYYSSILDEQDTQDLNEVAAENNKAINEKRAKRNEDMRIAKEAKEKEIADLLALGRAVRDNGGFMETLEGLKKTITDLETENIKLRKKQRKAK